MREIFQHPTYGGIVYEESYWTGKKKLTVNGVPAQPVSRKKFMINGNPALLKGNYLTGVSLNVEGETIQLSPKTTWYEIILAIIPLLFLLTWGSSPTLCSIFPVVGGAIGGLLGGVAIVISSLFMKTQKSPPVKVLIGLAVVVVTILIAFLLALVILRLLV